MTKLTGKMKLADMVDLHIPLLGIAERMGFRPGFGEATVAEACQRHGIDAATFLMICNVYCSDAFIPSGEELEAIDIREVVRYLRASHAYYLDTALTSLAAALKGILEPCPEKQRTVIRQFFEEYRTELRKHFEYEETCVFPYVGALSGGKPVPKGGVRQVGEDHSNFEEKVGDLKNILLKYLPETCDSTAVTDVLYSLYRLADDLRNHTRIEDIILMPLINRLEEHGRRK